VPESTQPSARARTAWCRARSVRDDGIRRDRAALGLTIPELARLYQCSQATICRALRSGVPQRRKREVNGAGDLSENVLVAIDCHRAAER